MRRHLCGTPRQHCTGSPSTVDKESLGTHATAHEAFACHRHYLITHLGHIPLGPRELLDPADGLVRVLTKKIRFGSPVRRGKGPEGGSAIGNRLADLHPRQPRILSL
jgi:hypothetical protein